MGGRDACILVAVEIMLSMSVGSGGELPWAVMMEE